MKRGIAIALTAVILYFLFAVAGMEADAAEPEEYSPYQFLVLTYDDEYLIAQTIESECGSGFTTIECKIATTQVILNRIMSERFGGQYHDAQKVIRNHSQFSTYPALLYCEPTDETWEILYDTLMGENLQIGYDVYFFSQGLCPGTEFVAKIGGHVFSR